MFQKKARTRGHWEGEISHLLPLVTLWLVSSLLFISWRQRPLQSNRSKHFVAFRPSCQHIPCRIREVKSLVWTWKVSILGFTVSSKKSRKYRQLIFCIENYRRDTYAKGELKNAFLLLLYYCIWLYSQFAYVWFNKYCVHCIHWGFCFTEFVFFRIYLIFVKISNLTRIL